MAISQLNNVLIITNKNFFLLCFFLTEIAQNKVSPFSSVIVGFDYIWHGAGSYEILYSSFFSSIFFIFLANFRIRLFKVAKNMLNILFFDWFGTSFQWFRAMSDEIRWKMTQNSKKMDDNFRIPCVIGDVACLHGLAECADASYLSLP